MVWFQVELIPLRVLSESKAGPGADDVSERRISTGNDAEGETLLCVYFCDTCQQLATPRYCRGRDPANGSTFAALLLCITGPGGSLVLWSSVFNSK